MEILDLEKVPLSQAIKKAVKVLQSGKIIVYPTETCYGLGADPTNQKAVDRLLKFKSRREGKAFSVAVADRKMAEGYVELNQTARQLYSQFLPGPLTVVSKVKPTTKLSKGVVSEFETLGVRIPDHPLALSLVKALGGPITATSANVSYQAPPYSLKQWQEQTPKRSQDLVDLWLDAGELPRRQPSTVIDTTVDELTVLRQGSLQFDAKIELVSRSEQDTHVLAWEIMSKYSPEITNSGLIIGLQGPLGAGKTQFAKGAAQALGITGLVRSPTFTLMHEYPFQIKKFNDSRPEPSRGTSGPGKKFQTKVNYRRSLDKSSAMRLRPNRLEMTSTCTFYHLDTWRLESSQEFINLQLEKLIKPGNLFIIEWVEKVNDEVTSLVKNSEVKLLWGNSEIIDEHTRRWTFSALE